MEYKPMKPGEREAEMPGAQDCFIEGDAIVFKQPTPYRIELDRCNTPGRILSWVVHLCERDGMNTALVRRFVLLAAQHWSIDARDVG
ncbi:MAG: hypothetical protein K2X00_23015 [Nitrospiraceae bacterium]|jgi:hypothetical protein|nr:hypothetical protein [Nitrospiraceae bacterium]